jgi:hypothetical protein
LTARRVVAQPERMRRFASLPRLAPLGLLALLAPLPLLATQACGGGSTTPAASEDTGVADTAIAETAEAGEDAPIVLDDADLCPKGSPCGDAGQGLCVGGNVCCAAASACGDACCGAGSVCSFGKCVVPGAVCVDATECKSDEICDYSLGTTSGGDAGVDGGADAAGDGGDGGTGTCTGGTIARTGRCLPRPPQCATPTGDAGVDGGGDGGGADAGTSNPDEVTCLDKCEWRPPTAAFAPELKFSWGSPTATNTADSVMMMPIVIQLDDDDCDGAITERDVPEIVFTTFASGAYTTSGTLHAISIVGGKVVEKWKVAPAATDPVTPAGELAAGNIDGKPGNEVVACTSGTPRLRAFDGKGTLLWTSPALGSCRMPSIADLDGDGLPEVITESNVVDGATGAIKATLAGPSGTITVADVDGDGKPDIVGPTKIWDRTGAVIADATAATVTGGALPVGNYSAVGDFDRDGVPEIVATHYNTHQVSVWRYDAAAPGKVKVLRRTFDINGPLSPSLCPVGSSGSTRGGGPPTIADFNGDGTPDLAQAGGVGYAVFDGKKLLNAAVTDPTLWIKQTHDCSSAATGSSVFDFDGDGKAEVIYSDEYFLRIYRGSDGQELWKTCNTTGTLIEYPVIADVDNDGHADIVVASNSYSSITCATDGSKQAGVRIFGDKIGQWVRTRRVWNEHAYHVTNVAEDGTIPKVEPNNWTQPRLDNFRQNVQPLGEFSAPDLVVSVRPSCQGGYALVARVRNLGEAAVEAPVVVGFYAGATKLGTASTTRTLYPAESEELTLPLASPPANVLDGTTPVRAVVDDGAPAHAWHECRTDNNQSTAVSGRCTAPG